MSRLRVLAILVILVNACGGPATPTPPPASGVVTAPSASPGGSGGPVVVGPGDPAFDAIQVDAVARKGEALAVIDDRGQLRDAMGVRAALGSNADQILALVAANEAAVDAKQVEVKTASVRIIDAAFQKFHSPYVEFRDQMAAAVQAIGQSGGQSFHEDLGNLTNTQTEGGWTGTTTQHTVLDIQITGSDVKVEIDRDISNAVTDVASGTALLTETVKHRVAGEIDACPNAAGLSPASLVVSLDGDATTLPGPGGGVGSHATGSNTRSNTFQGTVDDAATLGDITQTYDHQEQFKKTTSTAGQGDQTSEGSFTYGATGIDDGVPTTHDFGATIGDWSNAKGSGTQTGDVTAEMFHPMDTNAGSDYATMDQSYVAAQALWRDSRCVIVTAPTYIPKSAFANNGRPTHKEDVEKSSTTVFQVGLDHRFGQTVTAKIQTELDGKVSLDPQTVDAPPGTLTYVAPDKDGLDATVTLTSTSRQGIGRLVLTFHTGAEKLKVSISGTMTTSGFGVSYTTRFSTSGLVLAKQADGSYRGTGPITASMTINGDVPCTKPFHETGTLVLTAQRPPRAIANEGQPNEVVDETQPRQWKVTWDQSTNAVSSGTCVGISLGQFVQLGPTGMTGGFMFVLFGTNKDNSSGILTFPPEGDTLKIKKTTNVGPTKNTIDATIKGELISESKQ
jgi:hypothetical protein